MKIEIWSDFACPFCYIGKHRLEKALKQFPQNDQVEIIFKSFELDPNSPKQSDKNIAEILASKYGMSVEEAKKMNDGVKQQAESVGLTFNFDNMVPSNTFDAHRLAQYAQQKGKGKELTEKLFSAYFTDSKNLSDHEVLADIAKAVGLDLDEVTSVLDNEESFRDEVRFDQHQAQQIGVKGVPFFVFNQKFAISGAQSPETFLKALEKASEVI